MISFAYYSPTTIQHASSLLKEFGRDARLLAGGTDLLVRLKTGRFQPRAVIDLKGIPALNQGICLQGDVLTISALTTMSELIDAEPVRRYFPALVQAAATVGSVQIRNRATLAGNLCNASPAADTATPLLIYQARVHIVSETARRVVQLRDFFLAPGKTVLEPAELVESISLPIPPGNQAAAFERLTRRKGVDLATINLCCQVSTTAPARFALGAVGPTPFLVEDADGLLASPGATAEEKRHRLLALMANATPISDVRASKEYRQAMLVVLGRRALDAALERLHGQGSPQ